LAFESKDTIEHFAEMPEQRTGRISTDEAGIAQNSDELRSLGRDTGPISARNSSKGALLPEAHAVFRALASGKSPIEVRAACLTGRLLRQSARETRRRIWQSLDWRYFAWNPPRWILVDLAESAKTDASDRRFIGLAYLHYARRDRLTFDFVSDKLWSLWKEGARDVRRSDVMDFLTEVANHGSVKWRESTRTKLAGNVLSALRDFGLLTGVQRKKVHRPVLASEVVLHLCRLLDAEGMRGRALLEARDWRMFLWDIQDTSEALTRLAQRGDIRFERSGRTVVLEVPKHPLGNVP
jgi:hypothetical protein